MKSKATTVIFLRSLLAFMIGLMITASALRTSGYFNGEDKIRFSTIFESGLDSSSIETLYYSVNGLQLLKKNVIDMTKDKKICSTLSKKVSATLPAEIMFYIISLADKLKCKYDFSESKQAFEKIITTGDKTKNLFYAASSLKILGKPLDSKKVADALTNALKADDSALSYSFAFQTASLLSSDGSKFFSLIDTALQQADEVDGTFLHFDGDVFTTSSVIVGMYQLAEQQKKAPVVSDDRILKFANYFISRKTAQQAKSVYAIINAIQALTTNKYQNPVVTSLASDISVTAEEPKVRVRVCDLWGNSVGKMTIIAESAKNIGNEAVVMSRTELKSVSSDPQLFEVDFMAIKPPRGFYRIAMTLKAPAGAKNLVGLQDAEILIKVGTQITVEKAEFGIGDRDQSIGIKTTPVTYPNKIDKVWEADHHQRILFKFQILDQGNKETVLAHQVFVRMTNKKTKQEIVFVAESDANSNLFKFDCDIFQKAKDFGHVSGLYKMQVFIGDSIINNPIAWHIADIHFTFGDGDFVQTEVKSEDDLLFKPKKEIHHLFVKAEKRPPLIVSLLFTGLVLFPLLILFVLWVKVGVNLGNFSVNLTTVGFHLCLGGMFFVLYLYWIRFNMFDTIRYLSILAIPTFLCGQSLLRSISNRKLLKE